MQRHITPVCPDASLGGALGSEGAHHEPLSEAIAVMRIRLDDLVCVKRWSVRVRGRGSSDEES